MVRKALVTWLGFFLLPATSILAQTATPTTNVLTRVLMVESQYGRGSIFSLDVDKREYWITAKHIITGAAHPPYGSVQMKSVSLRILDPGSPGEKWLPVVFSVIDAGNDIDIVVLAAPKPLLDSPIASVVADSTGAFLGGDCEFLGFPYGGGWRAKFDNGKSYWMPFVKHCTVSAITNEDTRIWVLDGINNAGFSGGPVIFRTGPDQRIMAVVSGYHLEPTEVISTAASKSVSNGVQTHEPAPRSKGTVNLNSGFIISYDISYAIDAIHKNPIGPLRESK
jgi:hypothetical protein